MKISNTSERLTTLMSECNLRQVDILNAAKPFCEQYEIKLGKNDLSQYVNGKVEPGPEKLTVLALALNVSETWLMGYDVPRSRDPYYSAEEQIDLNIRGAKKWVNDFRFNATQKQRIHEYLADSALKLKQVVNALAEAEQQNGKILSSHALNNILEDISCWTGNALRYVNNDFSDDPYDEGNIKSQYLDAIAQLSRTDRVKWLIRIQDYIDGEKAVE